MHFSGCVFLRDSTMIDEDNKKETHYLSLSSSSTIRNLHSLALQLVCENFRCLILKRVLSQRMKLLPLKADSSISLSTKYRRDVGYNSYNPDFSSAWARPLIETRIYGKIRFLYHMNVSCFLSWAKYRGVFRARSTDGDVSRNICFQLKSFVAFVDCEFTWSLTA